MKALKTISALVLMFALSFGAKAQNNQNERLNLPGDNLNLYAVMNLFQESETIEGFERSLNAADSKVNNLDLNGDNLIDYIKVIDYVDGTTHSIVLQVAINQKENQDVAVFTVYNDKNNQVQIQLVGDEYLYGKDYIIEPYYAETPNPGYTGYTGAVQVKPAQKTTYVYVNTWPVVRYIYTPTYVVYRSPWYWGYYPGYWSPWRPYYWDYYYGYHSPWNDYYYRHYRHSNHYYNNYYANNYYRGHRSYSSTVRTFHDNGSYRNTYSRPDLRTKGSEEGRRIYTSIKQSPGRDNGQNLKSSGREINPGTTKPGSKDVGGTSTPNRKAVNESKSGRSANSKDVNIPSTRKETGRTIVQTQERSAKPAVRNTERPQTKVTTTRQEISKPKAPATARTSSKPAVNNSTNRSSNSAPAVNRSATKSSSKAATRTPSQSGKTSKSAEKSDSGRK